MEQWRLKGIRQGLAALDKCLPMAQTMDGRLPLHQDCRELLAEVDRLTQALERYGKHDRYCGIEYDRDCTCGLDQALR